MGDKLYKTGFIVAEMKQSENWIIKGWPLQDLINDREAKSITQEAEDKWFTKYDMLEIIPDLEYIKKYKDYCDKLKIDTKILLIESPYEYPNINKDIEIKEVLGYDCLGTVNYSYLYTYFKGYENELKDKNIELNKNGLLNKYEDVLKFIELRKEDINSGLNIENFWKEIPIRISIVNI